LLQRRLRRLSSITYAFCPAFSKKLFLQAAASNVDSVRQKVDSLIINVRNLEIGVKDIGIKFVKGQVCRPSQICSQIPTAQFLCDSESTLHVLNALMTNGGCKGATNGSRRECRKCTFSLGALKSSRPWGAIRLSGHYHFKSQPPKWTSSHNW
jgi:hypothetical protein